MREIDGQAQDESILIWYSIQSLYKLPDIV
jgi:hypothetical protein